MPTNPSVDFVMRAVDERLGVLKKQLVQLSEVLVRDKRDQKVEHAQTVLRTAENLTQVLAESDVPPWLREIISQLRNFVANPTRSELIQTLLNEWQVIQTHRWTFEAASEALPIDFDQVYRDCREHSRVPELFDQLIELLEQIAGCDEVDSLRAIDSLQRLVATLKANRNGSYYSVVCSWQFGRALLRNYLIELLKSTPILREVVNALEKTLTETDVEMGKMMTEITSRLEEQLPKEVFRPLGLPHAAPTADGHLPHDQK